MLLLTNELPFNLNSYLLPFAIVVAICFAIMVVFMVSDLIHHLFILNNVLSHDFGNNHLMPA